MYVHRDNFMKNEGGSLVFNFWQSSNSMDFRYFYFILIPVGGMEKYAIGDRVKVTKSPVACDIARTVEFRLYCFR